MEVLLQSQFKLHIIGQVVGIIVTQPFERRKIRSLKKVLETKRERISRHTPVPQVKLWSWWG